MLRHSHRGWNINSQNIVLTFGGSIKLFLLSATLFFLFQGYILDITKKAHKKDIIYGLGNEKVDAFVKVISLYNDGYTSIGKVFFCKKKLF